MPLSSYMELSRGQNILIVLYEYTKMVRVYYYFLTFYYVIFTTAVSTLSRRENS